MTKPHAPAVQEALFPAPPVPLPDLREYGLIIVSISGGKDSIAALAETVRHARKAGVLDRVITVFCDLGPGDEWPGTKELAAELLYTRYSFTGSGRCRPLRPGCRAGGQLMSPCGQSLGT